MSGLRILQVANLVTPDGAFGGPLRVAVNQTRQLLARGHDVDLIAGWSGPTRPPEDVDRVPVRLFPVHSVVPQAGFSGLYSLRMHRYLRANIDRYDVVHVHASRDLIAATALSEAHRRSVPTVVQTHGMVMPDQRSRSRVYDRLLGRPLIGHAAAHLALTEVEATGVAEAMRTTRPPVILPNGVPPSDLSVDPSTASAGTEVLFCARLHPRKRAEVFVAAAERLVKRYPKARFTVLGPDGGSLDDVRAAIARTGSDRISYQGALPYEAVLRRMTAASVYVLPSVAEPFPMSLLEAMSVGLPCVCTDQTGISAELARAGGAVVTDPSVEAVTAGIDRLLADPVERAAQGERARTTVERKFSMRVVGDTLEDIYATVTGRRVLLRRPSTTGIAS